MNDTSKLIAQYFTLATQADSDPYFAQFTPDATVEDEGQEHHGVAAIRAWRTQVPRVTYAVTSVEPAEAGTLARADISGDFPGSPVTLSFLLTFTDDGHISALAIR